ncbi:MAG: TetR/AcrR family transcriptional regulator [Acidobacteriota bacterium]
MNREQAGGTALGPGARERLLACALELFARKGYAATTVREIVQAANVAKPVLYYYFRNKEGIYIELMRSAFVKFEAVVDESTQEPAPAGDRILRLCDRVFALFLENVELARVMNSVYYGPPQGAPFFDFEVYHRKFQDATTALVSQGMRSGEFRKGSVDDAALAIIGALNIAMEMRLCHPEVELGRRGLARILRVIFEGVRRRERKGARR